MNDTNDLVMAHRIEESIEWTDVEWYVLRGTR